MQAVLSIVLPVFALIAVGYGFGRTRLMSDEGLRGFTNYTFYVAFSALLFRAMRNVRLETLDAGILLAYFAGALIVYGVVGLIGRRLFGLDRAQAGFMALGGCFSNGVGLGIPLIFKAFGDAGLAPQLMIIAVHSLILMTLTTVIVEWHRGGTDGDRLRRRLTVSAWALLRHPAIVAIVVGLAAGRAGLVLPEFAESALKLLADSAVPCGLVGLGLSLAAIKLGADLPQTLVMALAKLVALPALVYVLARYAVRLDPLWITVATVNAALPTGANVYLLAQKYDIYVARTTSVVLVSTALSIVTLAAWLALLIGAQP